MWFELRGDARLGRCATEGCGGQPTWRLEANGTGSNFCSGCKGQIMSWKSIKTAPKNKTILLWAATDIGESGEIKNWHMDTGYWSSGAECWVWEGRQVRKYDVQPTHWMLLPDPPDQS
jgi:hypothetical protein